MKPIGRTGIVDELIGGRNAGYFVLTGADFAAGGYINDNRREFIGIDAIHDWVTYEVVSQKVTIDVHEVFDQHGDTVVRLAYDGAFDKTGLPEEIVMTNYFSVSDGKICSLVIMFT